MCSRSLSGTPGPWSSTARLAQSPASPISTRTLFLVLILGFVIYLAVTRRDVTPAESVAEELR